MKKTLVLFLFTIMISTLFAMTVYDIQFTEDPSGDSPYQGQVVTIEEAVVVGVGWKPNGGHASFFVIDPAGGAWSGVYVFDYEEAYVWALAEGDLVTITATVDEYYGFTELAAIEECEVIDSVDVPVPVEISTADLASMEAYESCLVQVYDVTVTAAQDDYGQWYVTDGSAPCQVDDSYFYLNEIDPEIFINVDDLWGRLVGIVDYYYDEYGLNPRYVNDLTLPVEPLPCPTNLDVANLEGGTALFSWQSPNLPDIDIEEGFENEELPEGWTIIDNDNDGQNWFSYPTGTPHSGIRSIASASYTSSTGALTPDNWLISPAISLPVETTLNWWAAAQDQAFPTEHYSVMLSVSGTEIEDFTTILFDETLTSAIWHEVEVSLAEYTGETVHLAWRHHNCSDMFYMKIDDISITNTQTREEYVKFDFEEDNGLGKFSRLPSSRESIQRELSGYNVYLDGVMQNTTFITDSEYLFTGLADGITYEAGVRAIYEDGYSEIAFIEFNYNTGNNYRDIDGSGTIQAYDASLVLNYVVGNDPIPEIDPIPWEEWREGISDVDLNEMIQAYDASLILNYVVGNIPELPWTLRDGEVPSARLLAEYNEGYLTVSVTGSFYSTTLDLGVDIDEIIMLNNDILFCENNDKLAIASSKVISGELLKIKMSRPVEISGTVNTRNGQIDYNSQDVPMTTTIISVYPNPFNPETNISYQLAEDSAVKIAVYNVKGQLVESLIDEKMPQGEHQIVWKANNLPSGIYYISFYANGKVQMKKTVLIK